MPSRRGRTGGAPTSFSRSAPATRRRGRSRRSSRAPSAPSGGVTPPRRSLTHSDRSRVTGRSPQSVAPTPCSARRAWRPSSARSAATTPATWAGRCCARPSWGLPSPTALGARSRSRRSPIPPPADAAGRVARSAADRLVDPLEVLEVGELDGDLSTLRSHRDRDPRIEVVAEQTLELGETGWAQRLRGARRVDARGPSAGRRRRITHRLLDGPDRPTLTD